MFGSLRKRQRAPIRRQISKIYTKDEVLSRPVFEEICSEIIYKRWIPLLENSAESDEPLDVYELDLAITFDLSAAYIYGLPNVTNFLLDKAERRHWQDNYKVLKRYMFYGQEMYTTTTDLLPRWGINPMPKKLDKAVENLEEKGAQLAERIQKRHRDGLADDDEGILYHQLRNTNKGVEDLDDELEQKKRASEMIDHCFAGHGTASIVLTYMYHHLSIHPEYQRLLRGEIQTLDARPTQKEVDTLQLLEGVILETLRLFPSPPAGQPRITPEGGCTLGPYHDIPGGVRVSAQAYSLHRREEIFPEAERWWPERWLPFFGDKAQAHAADEAARESEQSRIAEMNQWYLGFGQGTRACPGKDYGMLGIKAIMAATYARFESRLASNDDMRQMDGNSEGQPAGQRCMIMFRKL
jgi:cytochrome P450